MNLVGKLFLKNSRSGFLASIQTLLTNVLMLAVNIVTGVVTARLLGPHDKGVQAAIVLWPGLLMSLAAIGLPAALLYHSKLTGELSKALLSAAVTLGLIAGAIGSVIGILMVPIWLANYSPVTIHITQLYMLVVPVAVVTNILATIAQANHDFQTYNAFRLSQPLITLVLLVLMALSHTLTPSTAAFAFLCPSLFALVWLWLRLRSSYPFSLAQFGQVYKRLLSYGFRYYSGDVLMVASSQLDKIVIVTLLNPASMGIYTVAYSLAGMLGVFGAAVNSVILPKMIDLPLPEVRLLLGRSVRINTVVSLCAAGVLVLLGPFLINLFYGNAYQGAIIVFFILAANAVIEGLAYMLAQVFYAVGKPELMMFRQIASLAIMIPGMFILGSRFGIIGVASVSLLESVFMVIITMSAFPSILKIRPPSLWAPREDLAYVLGLWREWRRANA